MKFSTIIILFVATVVSGAAVSIADINKDIEAIRRGAEDLRKSVHAFPVNGGGTIAQANVIRNDVGKFKASVDQGTNDVKRTPPFNEADARHFLEEIKQYTPVIVDFLHDVTARRHSFQNVQGVNAVPLVAQGLKEIGDSASRFGNALIKSDPDDLKSEGTKLQNELAVEFRKTLEVYSK